MKLRTAICLAAIVFGTNCSIMHAQTLTTLATFNGSNGALPYAGLIVDPSGNLYGTTWNGGANLAGTIFEVDAATHSLSTLFSFDGSNGAEPYAGVVRDASGNLYGTTRIGGTYGYGTVFELSASTHSITTLHSFNDGDGAFPHAGLTADANGNLYGATPFGAENGQGALFEIAGSNHVFTNLISFAADGSNGQAAVASLILGSDGNFYGTTAGGGNRGGNGTLFRLDAVTHALTTLASLGDTYGGDPEGGLLADTHGNLFGTTRGGGTNGLGTIFEYSATAQTLSVLATFDGSNGGEPRDGLIADASGTLYGTTSVGGTNNAGTVFKFDPPTGILVTLASFSGGEQGAPYASLVADASGNFYGTTTGTNAAEIGTVFELSVPEPGSVSVLAVATVTILICRRRGKLS